MREDQDVTEQRLAGGGGHVVGGRERRGGVPPDRGEADPLPVLVIQPVCGVLQPRRRLGRLPGLLTRQCRMGVRVLQGQLEDPNLGGVSARRLPHLHQQVPHQRCGVREVVAR